MEQIIRPHAEHAFLHELEALKNFDKKDKPAHWQLSPWAVLNYILVPVLRMEP